MLPKHCLQLQPFRDVRRYAQLRTHKAANLVGRVDEPRRVHATAPSDRPFSQAAIVIIIRNKETSKPPIRRLTIRSHIEEWAPLCFQLFGKICFSFRFQLRFQHFGDAFLIQDFAIISKQAAQYCDIGPRTPVCARFKLVHRLWLLEGHKMLFRSVSQRFKGGLCSIYVPTAAIAFAWNIVVQAHAH